MPFSVRDKNMITAKNYTQLFIQASLSQFTFLVKSMLSHEITHFHQESLNPLEPFEPQLEAIFNAHELLQNKYDAVLVLHDNTLNTLVPQALFDENALGAYLQYSTKVFATDFFAFDELDSYEMNNVYVPYMNINNFLIDKFGGFTYQNINTPLISKILDLNKNQAQTSVYAYFQKDHFELIVAQNIKLILFNSFAYQSVEDFMYYILFTYEQLGLTPEIHPLILLGAVEDNDPIHQTTLRFIRNVSFIKSRVFISNLLKIREEADQHYILFNL